MTIAGPNLSALFAGEVWAPLSRTEVRGMLGEAGKDVA